MKMKIQLLLSSTLLLTGCTYTDTITEPPDIIWEVPEAIEANQEMILNISVPNDSSEELQAISVRVQKQGNEEIVNVPFNQDANGSIYIQTTFEESGIYNLYTTLQTNDQTIKPIRQLVVGAATATESKLGNETESSTSEHH